MFSSSDLKSAKAVLANVLSESRIVSRVQTFLQAGWALLLGIKTKIYAFNFREHTEHISLFFFLADDNKEKIKLCPGKHIDIVLLRRGSWGFVLPSRYWTSCIRSMSMACIFYTTVTLVYCQWFLNIFVSIIFSRKEIDLFNYFTKF